jgi:hypothetical protein
VPKLYPLPGPVARSLEVVGDRWTLLVVRVLASLAAWGTRHCGEPSSAVATHAGCGGRVVMRSSCARCGAAVGPDALDVRDLP